MSDWTVEKLAKEASFTEGYIRRLLRNGVIKGEKFSYIWKIPEEEALKYLESLEKRGEEEPADS